MFDSVIQRHIIMRDSSALCPTCVSAPPIRLFLSEPYKKKYSVVNLITEHTDIKPKINCSEKYGILLLP